PEVLDLLSWHSWPGNVRELENCIERMVVLAQGERLTMADVPTNLQPGRRASGSSVERFDLPPGGIELADLEKHLIRQALDRTRGALGPAAKLLGVSYKTLQYRIRKYGFDREEFGGQPGEWAG
ncbi:MAG: helix-turn-helix domain-containing protein, partial [Acidobacteriota bacterium]